MRPGILCLAALSLVLVAATSSGNTIHRGAVIVVTANEEVFVDLHLQYVDGESSGMLSVLLKVDRYSRARIVNPFERASLSVFASGACSVEVYDLPRRPDPTRGRSRPTAR